MARNAQAVTADLKDSDWMRQSLFIRERGIGIAASKTNDQQKGEKFSPGMLSFSDTSLGGNPAINPPAGFTETADPLLPSLLIGLADDDKASESASFGMGRYYFEAIESNQSRIYMQFGIPVFNSLTNFFTTFYDRGQGQLVNGGSVINNMFGTIGKYAGYICMFPVVFTLAISTVLYKAIAAAQNRPYSKYYYVKPTMTPYWNMVSIMLNAIAANMKLISAPDHRDVVEGSDSFGVSTNDVAALNRGLPDIWRSESGGVDIHGIANRYQRKINAHDKILRSIMDSTDDAAQQDAKMQAYLENPGAYYNSSDMKATPIADMLKSYVSSTSGTGEFLTDVLGAGTAEGVIDAATGLFNGIAKHIEGYKNHTLAELRSGSAYVCFNVEHNPNATETFTNNTKTSDIASSMNETSRSSRSKLFDFANGNIGDGAISSLLEGAVGAVTSMIAGAADTVNLSGLAALGGKASVDIPDFYDGSDTTWADSSYTIQLRTPYGNPISVYQNIIVPLCMLLAGVAPRSTGRSSYGSPFYCKLWQKGRTQIPTGIIKSMTITRGTGNVGWNLKGLAIAVDVSFTVTNLSKVMHMPVASELSLDERFANAMGLSIFDEDSNYTDYMAVLGAMSINDQTYLSSKWYIGRARAQADWNNWFSMNNLLSGVAESIPAGVLRKIGRDL